jgi:hypothetical protein
MKRKDFVNETVQRVEGEVENVHGRSVAGEVDLGQARAVGHKEIVQAVF